MKHGGQRNVQSFDTALEALDLLCGLTAHLFMRSHLFERYVKIAPS